MAPDKDDMKNYLKPEDEIADLINENDNLYCEIERLRAALKTIAEWKDNPYWPAEETRDAIRYFANSALYEQKTADDQRMLEERGWPKDRY